MVPVIGIRIRSKIRELAETEAEEEALREVLSVVLEYRQNVEKRVQWKRKIRQIIAKYAEADEK